MRNFCWCERSTVTEDDRGGTSSESELGTMLLFRTVPDSSSADSASEGEDGNTKNNSDSVGGDVEDPMSEWPPLLCQKRSLLSCHTCDHEIRGSVVKEMINLQGRNGNTHALHAEYL